MSKLINVSNEVYDKLSEQKGDRSYSQIILGLLDERSNKDLILSFAGAGGIDEKDFKELRKDWKKWSEKYV